MKCCRCKKNRFLIKKHQLCNACNVTRWRKERGTYASFRAARDRCNTITNKDYPLYGGRGIKFLIKHWKDIEQAIGPRPEDHSLDRIDTNKHYTIANIRWATRKQQAQNTRKFKATEDMCTRVQQLYNSGLDYKAVAMFLAVSSKFVRTIIKRCNDGK